MEKKVYKILNEFKAKYPMSIAWRLKKHAEVVETHINPGENVLYAFAGQKGNIYHDLFHTCVVVITDKRILIASKRLIFGYFCISLTPDLFNDLTIGSGIIWGKVIIDTLNEEITITNLDKKSLPEVETKVSTYMMEIKQKYQSHRRENAE
ncbi:MAG: PH domain-containing protein [Bacilli bacterium]|nr:PH domain-containing protein [Bacilli bacterium]